MRELTRAEQRKIGALCRLHPLKKRRATDKLVQDGADMAGMPFEEFAVAVNRGDRMAMTVLRAAASADPDSLAEFGPRNKKKASFEVNWEGFTQCLKEVLPIFIALL